jgi:exo-beta-1,3-glucanase (GH17 family)
VTTDYVYVCPNPTAVLPTTAAPVKSTAVPTYAPVPQSSAPVPKPPAPAPELGGGDKWGCTYTPYTADGQCKGADAVAIDIALIKSKGFLVVRVYSTDCDTLANVGKAAQDHGLKLILGVFIGDGGIPGAQAQVDAIVAWGKWDLVVLIAVGNEALFSGKLDANSLAGFISSAAGCFKGAGYNGPITTTEPLNIWQNQGSALCAVIDIIGVNVHAFFNGGVTAAESGLFVKGQIELAAAVCPGKKVVNLECGWPNAGSPNGVAIPSPSEQNIALTSIIKEVGPITVIFSFEDDQWKDAGPFGVEKHWGCVKNI